MTQQNKLLFLNAASISSATCSHTSVKGFQVFKKKTKKKHYEIRQHFSQSIVNFSMFISHRSWVGWGQVGRQLFLQCTAITQKSQMGNLNTSERGLPFEREGLSVSAIWQMALFICKTEKKYIGSVLPCWGGWDHL